VSAYKLLLCPADPDRPAIDIDALAGHLQEIGLAGDPFALDAGTCYRTGERFLQLVTFLGCAPTIELDLPGDRCAREAACAAGEICHIRLFQTGGGLRFRSDDRMGPPRCPRCRQPLADWTGLIEAWRSHPEHRDWQCGYCGHRGRLFDLNFRKSAGFGHTFIEIWGIHPAEAVPVTALFDALEAHSGYPWKTLYVRD
jgi:hypothetical protein